MKIELFLNNQWEEIKVEVGGSVAIPKDETVESLSLIMQANTRELPYEPRTPLKLTYDDDSVSMFSLINDSVSVFSTNPLMYKHTLSLHQNIKDLDNYLIRNNVFTQPRTTQKAFYSIFLSGVTTQYWDDVNSKTTSVKIAGYSFPNEASSMTDPVGMNYGGGDKEPIVITSHYVARAAYVKFDFYGLYAKSDTTILTSVDNSTLEMVEKTKFSDYYPEDTTVYLTIHHKPLSGSETSQNFTIDDPIMGKEYEVPATVLDWIKTKASGSFYITFTTNHNNFMGTNTKTGSYNQYPLSIIANIELSIRQRDYTMYDVIQDLLKQQMKETTAYNSSNDSTIKPLFKMPLVGSECYNALQERMPDNFTFTQCTFYEALIDIFKLFDATFTIDENGYLGIDYYNDRGNKIENPQLSGINLMHSQEYYANGCISYFQNAIMNVEYPQDNFVPAQSKSLGIPQIGDYVFQLPKPINFINHLYIQSNSSRRIFRTYIYLEEVVFSSGGGQSSQSAYLTTECRLDIAHYLVSNEVWSSLTVNIPSSASSSTLTQRNTIAFNKGDKYIELAGYYNDEWNKRHQVLEQVLTFAAKRFGGVNTTGTLGFFIYDSSFLSSGINWSQLYLSIDYLAETDGRLRIESISNKHDGEVLTNQGNGMVDINKLGLNILGTALKRGEPKLTARYKIGSWSERIKVGQYFIKDNNIWVCNVANYTFLGNYIQGTLEFTQNYNEVASRIALNRQKRMTNISNSLTVKCEENYVEYIYFGEDLTGGESIAMNDNQIINLLHSSLFNFTTQFQFKHALLSTYHLLEDGTYKVINSYIYLPMIKYGSGNAICFEMSYDSPISAGNQLKSKTGWWSGTKYFSQAILYSDNEGYADTFSIDFYSKVTIDTNFPKCGVSGGAGRIANFGFYKKPNEIFALNYELVFLPKDQNTDFVGSEFINNNAFITGKPRVGTKLYVSYDEEYSVFDKKGLGEVRTIGNVTTYATTTRTGFKAYVANNIGKCKSWALCDENDNILFAHNNQSGKNYSNYVELYFSPRHHRF